MDIEKIMGYLPHRYPFLMVDRVISCEAGKNIVACKNVTINEPFFQGHFPVKPVMPGVMVIEALAQACGLLAFVTANVIPADDNIFYFVGIDKARFRAPVLPGDQLVLNVELVRKIRTIWKFSGRAEVDGKLVASAELMCAPGIA
ncbi:MAG: 3-hydroxyacyl-ACP dehydratase FabZ [Proteobacteria bacterium]|nr:3-hydroxyacyl-ACP dehydratase FabZ [Pseudomonadota bacterium]